MTQIPQSSENGSGLPEDFSAYDAVFMDINSLQAELGNNLLETSQVQKSNGHPSKSSHAIGIQPDPDDQDFWDSEKKRVRDLLNGHGNSIDELDQR